MSTSNRSKQAVRGAKSKGRRPPVKATNDVPILAIVVAAILLVAFIGLWIYGAINSRTTTVPAVHSSSAGDILCDRLEHSQVHYHVAVQLVDAGTTLPPFPGGVGIEGGESTPSCYYWLHVHSGNPGVIHIESEADKTYTLGDFMKVWDAWSTHGGGPHEPLDATHFSTITLTTGQDMKVYVDLQDGKGPVLYTGDPNKIPLKAHEVITVVIGPPDLLPSDGRFPTFDWKSGTNNGL